MQEVEETAGRPLLGKGRALRYGTMVMVVVMTMSDTSGESRRGRMCATVGAFGAVFEGPALPEVVATWEGRQGWHVE